MVLKKSSFISTDSTWYKDAVIYELPIKAFKDTNGDGIGDFKGLIEKLDYVEKLGVTAVWLLPFYPSPNKDGGYDISDYFGVSKDYGDIKDFKNFLDEAHSRGIKVITELVINHTSDQHPWFQRARVSPKNSNYRNFYVWSDTLDKYKEARIIFKDTEVSNWTYDNVAEQYFWHRFYSHQPDLNFENPEVHKALLEALDFWLNMGVDGLRLDAIPYLFEEDGTDCENLSKTHDFIKKVRKHIDTFHKNKMLLAEANQWPEDSAKYFGQGDECHMCFHFPIMPRMYMALEMQDAFPILNIMDETPEIDETCQWATFLRNHDELTLEMVTEEERAFMYESYAKDHRARLNLGIRRRLAPLMKNNRKKIELLNMLLFSIKGTPVLYYGDELGMGDDIYLFDRDGVRTPMQWSNLKNAGFSDAEKLYLPLIKDIEYHYTHLNVETQEANPNSLYSWTKNLIELRKKHKALSRGTLKFLKCKNTKILAFIREYEGETIFVAVNLSSYAQALKIDLSVFNGCTPVDLFSGSEFPIIDKKLYTLTFNAHEYYWFSLKQITSFKKQNLKIPTINLSNSWSNIFENKNSASLIQDQISLYFKRSSYIDSRKIETVKIINTINLGDSKFYLLVLKVTYLDKEYDIVQIPIGFTKTRDNTTSWEDVISKVEIDGEEGFLINPIDSENFRNLVLNLLINKNNLNISDKSLKSELEEANQHHYLFSYNDKYLLKFFKIIEKEVSNDYEYRVLLKNKNLFSEVIGSFFNDTENKNLLCILLNKTYFEKSLKGYFILSLNRYFKEYLIVKSKNNFKNILKNKILDFVKSNDFELTKNLADLVSKFQLSLLNSNNKINLMYQRSVFQTFLSTYKKMLLVLETASETNKNLKTYASNLNKKRNIFLNIPKFLIEDKLDFCKLRYFASFNVDNLLLSDKNIFVKNLDGETNKSIFQRKLEKDFIYDFSQLLSSITISAYEHLFNSKKTDPKSFKLLETKMNVWISSELSLISNEYVKILKEHKLIKSDADLIIFEKLLFVYITQDIMAKVIETIQDEDCKNLLIYLKVLEAILN